MKKPSRLSAGNGRPFFAVAGQRRCLWCWLALFLFLAGCASSPLKQARSDFYGGRPETAALALSDPSDVSKRDRLLYYMEKGVILHHTGQFEESIATLLDAAALIKEQDIISVTEQTGSLVTTEWITEYKGEYAERLLVHTYLMMGFLLTGRPESALVEARQALEVFDRFPKATARDHFTRALIAHCFEINGEINGAYIEYRKLAKQMDDPGPVADKLVYLAARLGFFDDVEKWRQYLPGNDPEKVQLPGAHQGMTPMAGELILFVSQGQAPQKVPRNIVLPPTIRFSFATYRERTRSFYPPAVTIASRAGQPRTVTTNVGKVLNDSLESRLARILAKETARVATKEVLAQQIDDPLAQALVRLAFFAMEEPDTRAWETLPAYMTLIRIPVDPGDHDLSVRTSGGTLRLPLLTVSPNRRFYHYSVRAGYEPAIPASVSP